jgi:hypothetical protein
MQVGEQVIAKVNGEIKICNVLKMYYEDVMLSCEGQEIFRKYWEIQKVKNEE